MKTNDGRPDWRTIRDRIDLVAVASELLGPPVRRQGSRSLWACPIHDDHNPSFTIEDGKPYWRCWGCGERGDAASLWMKINRATFPEAVSALAGDRPESRTRASPPADDHHGPRQGRTKPHRGMEPDAAASMVKDAASRLWSKEGRSALAYLRGRGLADETIRSASLGFVPAGCSSIPWQPPAILIPWFAGGRLARIKARVSDAWMESRPADKPVPKYLEIFRDGSPVLYPGPETIQPGRPVVLSEGEVDALLVGQELGDRAAAVTLGSASSKPTPEVLALLRSSPLWIVATDADQAGDRAAGLWDRFPRSRRVRPPVGKDWGDAHRDGPGRILDALLPSLEVKAETVEDVAADRPIEGRTLEQQAIAAGLTWFPKHNAWIDAADPLAFVL